MLENNLKKITQEEFDKILDLHNLWLNTNGKNGKRADLRNYNLTNIKFDRGVDLAEAHLQGANLFRANLAEANLTGANLEGANLAEANLTGANLEGANLEGANLEGANLTGAILFRVNLERAYLKGANLEGAYLEGANLERAHLEGANLKRVDLTYARNVPAQYLNSINVEKQTAYLQAEIKELKEKLKQVEGGETNATEIENLKKKLAEKEQKEQDNQELKKKLDEANQKLGNKLNENIANAIKQLEGALKNTDDQIAWNKWTGFACWFGALILLLFNPLCI